MDCEELELMEDGGGFSTDESVPDEQPPNRTVKYAHNDSIDSDHREVVYRVSKKKMAISSLMIAVFDLDS